MERFPRVTIADQPRFAWRGAMLDVARHFFTVDEVKQYIDLLALYKLNVLHLHLSDDQGWRIEIKSRPELTRDGRPDAGRRRAGRLLHAGATTPTSCATRTSATSRSCRRSTCRGTRTPRSSSYPRAELQHSVRPALYTGTDVGWSTFCVDKEATYALIDDIVREIAAITPAPYFHMGGDEVQMLTQAQYAAFVERVQDIVTQVRQADDRLGGDLTGEAAARRRSSSSGAPTPPLRRTRMRREGDHVAGASKTYLDMKYDNATELGLTGRRSSRFVTRTTGIPRTYMQGVVRARHHRRRSAALDRDDPRTSPAAQYLAMPRLPALAEVGWTPQACARLGRASARDSRAMRRAGTSSASTTIARRRSHGDFLRTPTT